MRSRQPRRRLQPWKPPAPSRSGPVLQAAELTAAHEAAQAALEEAANLALQGDVEAREAELATVALEMADTQQKYDGTLSQINALQLERNALTAETQRLSELSQASLDRLEAIGDSDTVLLIIERQQIEATLTDMRAERDTLQQTLLDLITQIDAAKVDIEDIEAEHRPDACSKPCGWRASD